MSSIDIILKWLKDRSSVTWKELVAAILDLGKNLLPYLPEAKKEAFAEKSEAMSDKELEETLEKLKDKDFSEKSLIPTSLLLSLLLKLLSLIA